MGYLFLRGADRLIPGELKELRDFKCFDGHESIVRVSAHYTANSRGMIGACPDWLVGAKMSCLVPSATFVFGQ